MVRGPGASSTWAGELPVALAVSSSLSESLRAPALCPSVSGSPSGSPFISPLMLGLLLGGVCPRPLLWHRLARCDTKGLFPASASQPQTEAS